VTGSGKGLLGGGYCTGKRVTLRRDGKTPPPPHFIDVQDWNRKESKRLKQPNTRSLKVSYDCAL
jgi:hypothetical protein